MYHLGIFDVASSISRPPSLPHLFFTPSETRAQLQKVTSAAQNEPCWEQPSSHFFLCSSATLLLIICRRLKKSTAPAAMLHRLKYSTLFCRIFSWSFTFWSSGVFLKKRNWRTCVSRNRYYSFDLKSSSNVALFGWFDMMDSLFNAPITFFI